MWLVYSLCAGVYVVCDSVYMLPIVYVHCVYSDIVYSDIVYSDIVYRIIIYVVCVCIVCVMCLYGYVLDVYSICM